MKRSEIIFGIIRVPVDFCMILLAFLSAYYLRTTDALHFLFGAPTGDIESLDIYFKFAIFAAFILLAIFVFEGMYSLKSTFRFKREVRRIMVLCAAWFMVLIAYFFVMRIQFFSRLILGYAFVLTILFIIFSRIILKIIQRFTLSKNIGKRRVVFVGNNKITEDLYYLFTRNPSYKVLGLITNGVSNFKVLGEMEDLEKILNEKNVDEVIQTQSNFSEKTSIDVLEACRVLHVTYRFVPDLLEVQRTNVELNFHKGIPVIALKETPLDAWGRVAKRVFDLLVSAIFILLLSPLFIIVSILIKFDSRGAIFYKSKRVTTKGRTFEVYKFRSMVVNAEKKKKDLAHLNHRTGPLFKIKDDPRITKLGKFIRKTSIDELPQLFNVFRGNMSLVGPRPHLPDEVAQYKRHHQKVLAIKPGITGMAQISGRSDLDFEEEVKLDTYYIENWSLLLDIIILLKTVPAVLRGNSAD